MKEQTSLYTDHWVDGEGPLDAEILLVGQAPGAQEARTGRPFVGPAGQMLQSCVAEAGLDWATVRRTNAVRCRPPQNRKPTIAELKEYLPWLLEEIAMMPNLRVIVALGNEAMYSLMKKSGITDKRGEEITREDGIIILPTFHPSYVLRAAAQRPTLVKDLVRARRLARGESLDDPATGIMFVEEVALHDL